MTNAKPLSVVYMDIWPGQLRDSDATISRSSDLKNLESLKAKIEDGSVDRVYIVGRHVATGWRLLVDREVQFDSRFEGTSGSDREAIRDQAEYRIVNAAKYRRQFH